MSFSDIGLFVLECVAFSVSFVGFAFIVYRLGRENREEEELEDRLVVLYSRLVPFDQQLNPRQFWTQRDFTTAIAEQLLGCHLTPETQRRTSKSQQW